MIRFRRVLGVFWWLSLVGLIAAMIHPVSVTLTRLAAAGGLMGLWLITLALLSKSRRWFVAVLLAGVLPGLWFMLPGRELDRTQKGRLSATYLYYLLKYEGTPYVWGGENGRGIDCSGLVRRALINANLERGLLTLNPALVRKAITMTWQDRTAKALGEGVDGLTRKVGEASSLNALEKDFVVSTGTLAVTKNGVHVLVRVNKLEWIQAAPGEGKVVTLKVPSENSWYHVPVVLLEWTQLSDPRYPALIDMR